MKILIVAFLVSFSSYLLAIRPIENHGGSQQLDLEQLEKSLSRKFDVTFPSENFDIDYFYRGDLLQKTNGEVTAQVTCPFVVGEMIVFVIGNGKADKEFALWQEVSLDLGKEGRILALTLAKMNRGNGPDGRIDIVPREGETNQELLKRTFQKWTEATEKEKWNAEQKAGIALASELLTAIVKQL